MSRRERLLEIGNYFTDREKLREAVGKDVVTDMAIALYALYAGKVYMLEGILDIEELEFDILHTEQNYFILDAHKRLKEE